MFHSLPLPINHCFGLDGITSVSIVILIHAIVNKVTTFAKLNILSFYVSVFFFHLFENIPPSDFRRDLSAW